MYAGVPDTIRSSFELWNSTSWSGINVDQMEMDCKKFTTEIRSFDKDMRSWNTFLGSEPAVTSHIFLMHFESSRK